VNLYRFAKTVLSGILKIKGCKVEGLANVPPEGPLIIACNHISIWDPIMVGCALPRQVYFMAKDSLFAYPVFGEILRLLGAFPVKRGQGDIGAIKRSLAILKEGKVLGIFPEGTRSKTGDIQEAMAGIVLIMEKSKAPVLPVKVYGSSNLLQQKRGEMGIIIGKPIDASKLVTPTGVEDRRPWIAKQIMEAIEQI